MSTRAIDRFVFVVVFVVVRGQSEQQSGQFSATIELSKTLKVLAVGAAGPSASLVIPELLKRNVSVRAFIHKSEDEPTVQKLGVTDVASGELSDATAVATSSTSRRLLLRMKLKSASILLRLRSGLV